MAVVVDYGGGDGQGGDGDGGDIQPCSHPHAPARIPHIPLAREPISTRAPTYPTGWLSTALSPAEHQAWWV